MIFGVPQAIWLTLNLIGLGIYLAKDGHPKNDNYSFWTGLLGVIINGAILYFGGFFG